jgi:hypothetical protein
MELYAACLPLSSWSKKAPARNAQGIEAEIPEALPQVTCGKAEELERIARFPALCAGNAPKTGG